MDNISHEPRLENQYNNDALQKYNIVQIIRQLRYLQKLRNLKKKLKKSEDKEQTIIIIARMFITQQLRLFNFHVISYIWNWGWDITWILVEKRKNLILHIIIIMCWNTFLSRWVELGFTTTFPLKTDTSCYIKQTETCLPSITSTLLARHKNTQKLTSTTIWILFWQLVCISLKMHKFLIFLRYLYLILIMTV